LSAGAGAFCGITDTGVTSCWGIGPLGELGDGRSGGEAVSFEPRPIVGDLRFASISLGSNSGCGLTIAGEAHCWGNNFRGYLGRAGPSSSVPVPVAGGHAFATLSVGATHACGITPSGEVWCWGAASSGQLGRDESLGDASEPIRVTLPPE
jgi:alpha-tubulin suppressor-like RCC1 family protein